MGLCIIPPALLPNDKTKILKRPLIFNKLNVGKKNIGGPEPALQYSYLYTAKCFTFSLKIRSVYRSTHPKDLLLLKSRPLPPNRRADRLRGVVTFFWVAQSPHQQPFTARFGPINLIPPGQFFHSCRLFGVLFHRGRIKIKSCYACNQ